MPELILLVGSNPLPNYLAARPLGHESICLFYTLPKAKTHQAGLIARSNFVHCLTF
jgi:hypothetical protein